MVWTSAAYTVDTSAEKLTVEVKETIAKAVQEDTDKLLAANIISLKDLREYCGRVVCMSSLLSTWRPCLSMLWAPHIS